MKPDQMPESFRPPAIDASQMRPTRRSMMAGAAAMAIASAFPPQLAWAQSAAFLDGQTIEFLSGNSPGTASAIFMEEWARAVERLLPNTRVVYRPSAGGTQALMAAQLAASEPNGLTLGTVSVDSVFSSAAEEAAHPITEFSVIASLNRVASVLLASTNSGITSISQLVDSPEPFVLPVRATVSNSYIRALFVNALLGTRIQPVTGYGGGERSLAFVNGESSLYAASAPSAAQFVEDGTGVCILRYSDDPVPPSFGNPPALSELDHDPAFAWIIGLLNASSANFTVTVPKQTPPDRIEVLRDLFMRATEDPQFIAAVEPLTEIAPTRGDVVQSEIDAVIAEYGDLSDDVSHALECGLQVAQTGERCPA